MNELPKSVRDELARQQGSALDHPDADLLTAFAEGAATPAERARIEQHLALCGQCREVMFLATPAQEASSTALELKPQRRTRWFPVWVPWAAAATILFAATWTVTSRKTEKMALYSKVEQDKRSTGSTPQQTPAASTLPPAAAPEAGTSAPKPPRQPSGGSLASLDATEEVKREEAEHAARARRDEDVFEAKKDSAASGAVGGLVANEDVQTSTLAKTEAAPAAAPPPPPTAAPADRVAMASRNTSLKPGPAAPVQNQTAQNQNAQNLALQAEVTQNSPGTAEAKAVPLKTMARAMGSANIHWRISPDGHLERQLGSSGWTPVTLAAGTHFTVVASVGSTVWAGNDIGGLYRSDDGGANWTSTALPGLAQRPGSRITAIEFRDALSGEVATADGSRWSTADGGRSWQHN